MTRIFSSLSLSIFPVDFCLVSEGKYVWMATEHLFVQHSDPAIGYGKNNKKGISISMARNSQSKTMTTDDGAQKKPQGCPTSGVTRPIGVGGRSVFQVRLDNLPITTTHS